MITAGNKEKSASSIERQSSNIRAAGIPFRNNFLSAHINSDGRAGSLDIRVKKSAFIISGIAFAQTIQRNFRFPFQMPRIVSVEKLQSLSRLNIAARNRPRCADNFY